MTRDRTRESLEKRLEALTDDYSDLSAAVENETEPVTRRRHRRRLKEITDEMYEIEDELEDLSLRSNSQRRPLDLQSKLPEIDFGVLEGIIQKILRDYGDSGCAALLLFQKSARMGGEWCAARIREMLRRETNDGQFRHIPVEFQPSEQVDAMTLLRSLGQDLGIEPDERDQRDFSLRVVQKLCGSLRNGNVVVIECRRCDYLSLEPGIFHWVLENFWAHMVRELAAVAQEYSEIKVIVLLFVDGLLPEGCLTADQCCTLEQFQKDKLLEIPLELWTREDIKQWIGKFSGMSLHRTQLERMADKVYRSTDGLPTLVVHELLKEW